MVGLSYGGETGCDGIMACLCDHSGDGLTCANGQLRVMPSEDPGNLVQIGGDGGVFVPTAGASTGLVEGQAVDITGDQAGGYTIGARISADPENAVVLGSDGGLYVPGPRYAYGDLTPRVITNDITDNWLTPTIKAESGGFAEFNDGIARVRLPDGGTWFIQAQFRFDASAGFTSASGGMMYGAISAAGRGYQTCQTITRSTTVAGFHVTTMDDFANAATPSVSFRVQANSTFAARPSVAGWWSVHRVGPSIA